MSANLEALLNMKADEVEKPLPLPAGDYLLKIVKREGMESSNKKTPGQKFTFLIEYPHESVDKEALEKVKGWRQKELTDTFYLTPNSMWRLAGDQTKEPKQDGFFQFLGINTEGKSVIECLSETIGRTVMATVVQEVNQEGTSSFNKIKKYQRP